MNAITVDLAQEVQENAQYITSEGGEFDATDFVLCQHKADPTPSTCAFLATSVVGINQEEPS